MALFPNVVSHCTFVVTEWSAAISYVIVFLDMPSYPKCTVIKPLSPMESLRNLGEIDNSTQLAIIWYQVNVFDNIGECFMKN